MEFFKRQHCAQLGSCLEYPADDLLGVLQAQANEVESFSEEAAAYLKSFIAEMCTMELWTRQEHYIKTFDVMPQCSLYLSVHLFGEESFKRSELMAGLKGVYEKYGAFEMTELPDHLAVVLKQNTLFEEGEWTELVSMCVLPAIPKIIGELEKHKNPYALVLKAIQTLLTESERACV